MKKLLLALTIGLFSTLSWAQSLELEWAIAYSPYASTICFEICTDANGNIYSTGVFWDTVQFGPGPGAETLTSFGSSDIYILKQAPNGEVLWVKQLGGSWHDCYYVNPLPGAPIYPITGDIDIDSANNIYVTGTVGTYYGIPPSIDFDPGTDTFNVSLEGEQNGFVLKLNNDGEFQWVSYVDGGDGLAYGRSSLIDPAGNVYTLYFSNNSSDYDPGVDTLTFNWYDGGIIRKLDSDGNFIWAKQFGDWTASSSAPEIKLDAYNNIFLVGEYHGNPDFDPGPDTVYLGLNNNSAVFFLKLDTAGNFLLAKGFSSSFLSASETDKHGNLYIAGRFQGKEDLDPGPDTLYSTTNEAYYGSFISKFDNTGNLVWSRQIEDSLGYNQINSIAIDGNDYVYISGYFNDDIDVDPGPDIVSLVSNGNQDGFIWVLDSIGDFWWASKIGASYNDNCNAIELSDSGFVYVYGYFRDTVDFDPGPALYNIISNVHNSFALKLSPDSSIVGIKDNTNSITGTVYPNPNNGNFFLSLPSPQQEINVKIRNIHGQLIESKVYNFTSLIELELNETPGLYFLEVIADGKRSVFKMIKQ